MPSNWVLEHRKQLEERNYIRQTDTYESTVFFEEGKVAKYRKDRDVGFNLIIVGSKESANDFYVLPYSAIRHMLTEQNIKTQKDGRRRWHLSIRDDILRVGEQELPVAKWRGVRVSLADGFTIGESSGRA